MIHNYIYLLFNIMTYSWSMQGAPVWSHSNLFAIAFWHDSVIYALTGKSVELRSENKSIFNTTSDVLVPERSYSVAWSFDSQKNRYTYCCVNSCNTNQQQEPKEASPQTIICTAGAACKPLIAVLHHTLFYPQKDYRRYLIISYHKDKTHFIDNYRTTYEQYMHCTHSCTSIRTIQRQNGRLHWQFFHAKSS